ncbi:MAG: type II toxin-antitoxin system RelE/ParE family toxin [Desulfamplus sp.]|nr:type II toxin-antitoxin system RelE/ParE family toxin [Desulfamplus sp.]
MISKFKHKGLKKLFESGIISGVQPDHANKLRKILALLETAESPDDMELPGLKLHPLKGNREGTWSVTVSGNWRVTFQFCNSNTTNIDYEDYH